MRYACVSRGPLAWKDVQAAVAAICTHAATALWHAVAGVHVDESASVLRYLTLATSEVALRFFRKAIYGLAAATLRFQSSQARAWMPLVVRMDRVASAGVR